MRIPPTKSQWPVYLILTTAVFASSLHARSYSEAVSIDFGTGGAQRALGVDEAAGWFNATKWVSALGHSGSLSNAATSSGNPTQIAVTWSANNLYQVQDVNTGALGGNYTMMYGYVDTSNTSTTEVRVQNLPARFAAAGYDVIVYVDGSNGPYNRVGRYELIASDTNSSIKFIKDGAGKSFTGEFIEADSDTPPQTAASGVPGNMVVFRNVKAHEFTLLARGGPGEAFQRAPISAIQIAKIDDGLIAHYPFKGNANDESGNSRHGTAVGASLTQDRFGNPDSAYHFNGSSWIETSEYRLLDGADSATISAWVLLESGKEGQLLSTGDFRAGYDPISMYLAEGGTTGTWLHDTVRGNTHEQQVGVAGYKAELPKFLASRWHHFVVALSREDSRGVVSIYLDGKLAFQRIGTITGANTFERISYDRNMRFLIGAIEGRPFYSTPGQFWSGKIDDVRIYNRALTQDELRLLYTNEVGMYDGDGDNIPDVYETATGIFVNPTDTGTDPYKDDTDSDGLLDGSETATGVYVSPTDTGTDPNVSDTDQDGLSDGVESHTKVYVGETDTGTDPNNADTSGDSIRDGEAVLWGFNPLGDYSKLISFIKHAAGQSANNRFDLYTTQSISDLNLGNLFVRKFGNTVSLRLQLQMKDDLTGPWQDHSSIPIWIDMPTNKGFLRIKALGPQ